jgi:predicted  nucleic acid-binding Zn-ribbon protein
MAQQENLFIDLIVNLRGSVEHIETEISEMKTRAASMRQHLSDLEAKVAAANDQIGDKPATSSAKPSKRER